MPSSNITLRTLENVPRSDFTIISDLNCNRVLPPLHSHVEEWSTQEQRKQMERLYMPALVCQIVAIT